MFSGLVEAIAHLLSINQCSDSREFIIARPASFTDLLIGESIAINGVCLTVTNFDAHSFSVIAVPETLQCTNLGVSVAGDAVNLARAMRLDSRLGGHFVQGHVDAVGTIIEFTHVDELAYLIKIELSPHLLRYIVAKGFITIDGMSITVIDTSFTWFTATLIPHTVAVTISQYYKVKKLVNIEVDMIGKYVEKIVGVYLHDAR